MRTPLSSPSRSPNTRLHHRLGNRAPGRVHDRRPGLVVGAVEIGVEARRVPPDPVVEQVDDLLVASARRGAAVEHPADDRPDERVGVLGRGPVHDPDVVGDPGASRPLVEQLDALHGAVGLVVAVHEAGRRLVVPVQQQAVGTADPVRMLVAAQEALPLVVAGAERRQPAVEAASPDRQSPGAEVGGLVARGVSPVEGEAELVRGLVEALRRRCLAHRHVAGAPPG